MSLLKFDVATQFVLSEDNNVMLLDYLSFTDALKPLELVYFLCVVSFLFLSQYMHMDL